ncbi:MAG: T9SS type A sorting domain-containing protein [Bacteroidota bacterium]|nr:T9SS type A sorting domain-containing protein [Bacteroidota bacterium]
MKSNKLFAMILAGVILFGQGLIAQTSSNMTLMGNYGKGEGETKAIFAAGSVVYYALGSKVQIASFTNPATPVKIGSVILTDVIEDLVRTSINSTQHLVVSGGTKVWLINVQNPTLPSLVSTIEIGAGATCEGVATSGTYAYVAAGSNGFKIYNIANPASPVLVKSIDSLAYCESVVISGQYAYIAAGSRSHIVDISDPAVPLYVGRINGYGGYHQYLNVRSGYAYVCNYDASLSVVNVTNPANPVNVIDVPSGYRTARIIFDGNYAYVAVGDTGMVIYDVVNPAAPVLTAKIKTTGRAASLYYGAVTVGGSPKGHIFVANRNPAPGVSAINVSTPASPVTASFLGALAAPSGTAYIPYYANGKAYVAYGTAGLRIIDVSNPSSLLLLSTTALGGDSRAVVASGNYAYVAARDSGVYIVDVTNANAPVKIKTIKMPSARGIAVSGTKVYVAASDSGMVVIDITNPTTASIVAYTGKSVYGENVTINGNTAGLTDYSFITFYDVTTPSVPVKKGTTTKFRVGNEGFAIAGNYAYVPDGDSMKVFDITNLLTPTQVAKIKTGGYGYVSAVAGDYCYVASEGTGVRSINISNPLVPVEAGFYDGVPQSRGLVVDGKYIYVAEKGDGLAVYSNNLVIVASDKVTFQVNMSTQMKIKKFDRTKDTVVVRGDFQGWGGNAFKLTDIDDDSIYIGNFSVPGAPKNITYKYVKLATSVSGDQWEAINDRKDTIPSTPMTLPVAWFNKDSTSVYSDNFITFQVNMKKQIKFAKFDIAKDSVVVRGDFSGWDKNAYLLTDSNNDSIYTGTHNIVSVKKIIYKFVIHKATGDTWPSSPDRIDTTLNGTPKTLPVVWFSNDSVLTGVRRDDNAIATTYELLQNYPNPFNPSTKIDFSILADGLVSLKVYNLLGQEVATIVNQQLNAGKHIATFNASNLSSGVYFYKIEAGTFTSIKKMTVLK